MSRDYTITISTDGEAAVIKDIAETEKPTTVVDTR